MAALPNSPASVPVDEYLSTSYRPEMEYVDGVLEGRGMPTEMHGIFQMLLGAYFLALRKQFQFVVSSAARTQIVERARYRAPDVVLAPLPAERGVITRTPWVVIEIQSSDDKPSRMMHRFRDLESIGVLYIVWMDPEERAAFRYKDGALFEMRFTELELPTGRLPFDSEALFEQLAEEFAAR
jgi:Uma2 family endonuclease